MDLKRLFEEIKHETRIANSYREFILSNLTNKEIDDAKKIFMENMQFKSWMHPEILKKITEDNKVIECSQKYLTQSDNIDKMLSVYVKRKSFTVVE